MESLAVKLAVCSLILAPAVFIHFRGKVRHTVWRQLTDHSTFIAPYNVLVYLFSAVPNRPFLDREKFPDVGKITENWRDIRDEAMKLYEAGHIRPAGTYNDIAFNTFFKRGWKRFYLKWYDDFLPSAKTLCPKSVELVESVPSIHAAMFALLPPGGKLGAHRDPFAGSVRYHLGLKVPKSDKCRIYVDGNPYVWKEGEGVFFDETFIHSAYNDSDEPRIILFCDVERPLRTRAARLFNHWVAKHIVKITASRNEENEKIGAVNWFSGYIYQLKLFFRKLKEMNRQIYYAGKYSLILFLIYAVFLKR